MVKVGARSRGILRRSWRIVAACAACVAGSGCASSPEPVAFQNRVFYQYDTFVSPKTAKSTLEVPYPPLDKAVASPLPEYIGVGIIGGRVHLSRPREWVIRAASTEPEHRYIEYVSPNEYMVAIYELVESPLDPWLGVMTRYEDQAKKAGADLLGKRVPMATENTQGRAYLDAARRCPRRRGR